MAEHPSARAYDSATSLIVVDVQNDFCAGGALAVPDGDAVVEPINRLAREARFVVATRDWQTAAARIMTSNRPMRSLSPSRFMC